uniref:Uncharacterized protein n=1 Tax=Anguilla anguilla TaxID=7936 RepID=A0A0E9QBS3_ANGAN
MKTSRSEYPSLYCSRFRLFMNARLSLTPFTNTSDLYELSPFWHFCLFALLSMVTIQLTI